MDLEIRTQVLQLLALPVQLLIALHVIVVEQPQQTPNNVLLQQLVTIWQVQVQLLLVLQIVLHALYQVQLLHAQDLQLTFMFLLQIPQLQLHVLQEHPHLLHQAVLLKLHQLLMQSDAQ